MSFVMVYPVLFILSAAFKGMQDVHDPTVVWLPKNFSLRPLKLALEMLDFENSFTKTVSVVLPSVFLQLISSLLAGYGFARFKFRGKNILFAVLIFTIIVPVQTYMIPLYVGFRNFDFFGIGSVIGWFTGEPMTMSLLNTNVPFYLMAGLGAGIRSGLYIFMLRQFFMGMPRELDEAASIDGCGPLQVFLRVMIPNAIPMMVTIVVFSLVWYWNDYYLSSMFFDELPPLSQKLAEVADAASYMSGLPSSVSVEEFSVIKEGVLACGCLLTILPPLILYIFAQRYFTEGLERSGIVG
jgi:multiple sugar transport system permease protein